MVRGWVYFVYEDHYFVVGRGWGYRDDYLCRDKVIVVFSSVGFL